MRTKFVIDSIKIALILFLIFGLGYPLLIYGIGQTSMPYQANGEPFVFDNRTMGSMLLYINFGSTAFFSTNNSYYDPYVSVNQAYAE
ncbi:MAG: potassium-transporting ATPase subunit C, partial [Nitrososphaerota archaeon]|nr:potassium-transporting ATPase subunit C [Nitrososphaerota archaeon]